MTGSNNNQNNNNNNNRNNVHGNQRNRNPQSKVSERSGLAAVDAVGGKKIINYDNPAPPMSSLAAAAMKGSKNSEGQVVKGGPISYIAAATAGKKTGENQGHVVKNAASADVRTAAAVADKQNNGEAMGTGGKAKGHARGQGKKNGKSPKMDGKQEGNPGQVVKKEGSNGRTGGKKKRESPTKNGSSSKVGDGVETEKKVVNDAQSASTANGTSNKSRNRNRNRKKKAQQATQGSVVEGVQGREVIPASITAEAKDDMASSVVTSNTNETAGKTRNRKKNKKTAQVTQGDQMESKDDQAGDNEDEKTVAKDKSLNNKTSPLYEPAEVDKGVAIVADDVVEQEKLDESSTPVSPSSVSVDIYDTERNMVVSAKEDTVTATDSVNEKEVVDDKVPVSPSDEPVDTNKELTDDVKEKEPTFTDALVKEKKVNEDPVIVDVNNAMIVEHMVEEKETSDDLGNKEKTVEDPAPLSLDKPIDGTNYVLETAETELDSPVIVDQVVEGKEISDDLGNKEMTVEDPAPLSLDKPIDGTNYLLETAETEVDPSVIVDQVVEEKEISDDLGNKEMTVEDPAPLSVDEPIDGTNCALETAETEVDPPVIVDQVVEEEEISDDLGSKEMTVEDPAPLSLDETIDGTNYLLETAETKVDPPVIVDPLLDGKETSDDLGNEEMTVEDPAPLSVDEPIDGTNYALETAETEVDPPVIDQEASTTEDVIEKNFVEDPSIITATLTAAEEKAPLLVDPVEESFVEKKLPTVVKSVPTQQKPVKEAPTESKPTEERDVVEPSIKSRSVPMVMDLSAPNPTEKADKAAEDCNCVIL